MAGVNKVILVGRLGQDPELKYTNSGTSVCRFSIATSENWKDKEGQKQERTEWHRIVVWGKLGTLCSEYLKKGRQVYLEGRIQTRSWEDKSTGQKRYTTEVVGTTIQFLGSAKDRNEAPAGPSEGLPNDTSFANQAGAGGASEEDIPF